MPVWGDDLKVKKEPVVQKVKQECYRQRKFKRTLGGKDIVMCHSSLVARHDVETRVGSCRTWWDMVKILDFIRSAVENCYGVLLRRMT